MTEQINFPFKRTTLVPPEQYGEFRRSNPVPKVKLPTGQEAYLLTRYDDVRSFLLHPNVSARRDSPHFPALSEAQAVPRKRSILNMDPPDHARYRKLIAKYFTVPAMERFRPTMRSVVQKHYDSMLSKEGEKDFVRDFALAVPSELICLLLGIPYDEYHEFFEERTAITTTHGADVATVEQAEEELRDYVAGLVKQRQEEPGDDLISYLVTAAAEHGLPVEDMAPLVHLVLIGGHETSANVLSLSRIVIFNDPERVAALRDDPSLIPSAVEELLRYTSVSQYMAQRHTVGDVEVNGTVIPKDSGVVALVASANFDDTVFPEPEEFQVDRNPRHHVTFGFGAHQCLGQHFARFELEEAFDVMLNHPQAIDTLVDHPDFKYDSFVFGLQSLPVQLEGNDATGGCPVAH